jgi:hypothetical protein
MGLLAKLCPYLTQVRAYLFIWEIALALRTGSYTDDLGFKLQERIHGERQSKENLTQGKHTTSAQKTLCALTFYR